MKRWVTNKEIDRAIDHPPSGAEEYWHTAFMIHEWARQRRSAKRLLVVLAILVGVLFASGCTPAGIFIGEGFPWDDDTVRGAIVLSVEGRDARPSMSLTAEHESPEVTGNCGWTDGYLVGINVHELCINPECVADSSIAHEVEHVVRIQNGDYNSRSNATAHTEGFYAEIEVHNLRIRETYCQSDAE